MATGITHAQSESDVFPPEDFFSSVLSLPYASIAYSAHRLLVERCDRHVIQCNDTFFDVEKFARAGKCTLAVSSKPVAEVHHEWTPSHIKRRTWWYDSDDDETDPEADAWMKLASDFRVGWYDVTWQPPASETGSEGAAVHLQVVVLNIPRESCGDLHVSFVLSDSHEVGSNFILSVEKFVWDLKQHIWVFENGGWSASVEMYEDVQNVTFGNMVMAADKGVAIKKDLELFLQSQSMYEEYGLPWKRGYLFTGPPGNGKTHLVKALINHVTTHYPDVSPLYVKSFKEPRATSTDRAIARVFQRARQRTCILLLEDIDTLIDDTNRAFFLNEMDGFHSNHGIIVMATTNHPDKLDAALRDRPSRFDRTYHFGLPGATERHMYFESWNALARQPELKLSSAEIEELASDDMTDGFSFAYLKELLLSTAMQWILKVSGSPDAVNSSVNGAISGVVDGVKASGPVVGVNGVNASGPSGVKASGPVVGVNGVNASGPSVSPVSSVDEVKGDVNGIDSNKTGEQEDVARSFGALACAQVGVLRKHMKAVREREDKEEANKDKPTTDSDSSDD